MGRVCVRATPKIQGWRKVQTQDEFDRLDVLAQSVAHERVHGAYLAARRERLFELGAVRKAHPDRGLSRETDRTKKKKQPCVIIIEFSRDTIDVGETGRDDDDVRWASDRAWSLLAPRVERGSEAAHCSPRPRARGAVVAAP